MMKRFKWFALGVVFICCIEFVLLLANVKTDLISFTRKILTHYFYDTVQVFANISIVIGIGGLYLTFKEFKRKKTIEEWDAVNEILDILDSRRDNVASTYTRIWQEYDAWRREKHSANNDCDESIQNRKIMMRIYDELTCLNNSDYQILLSAMKKFQYLRRLGMGETISDKLRDNIAMNYVFNFKGETSFYKIHTLTFEDFKTYLAEINNHQSELNGDILRKNLNLRVFFYNQGPSK